MDTAARAGAGNTGSAIAVASPIQNGKEVRTMDESTMTKNEALKEHVRSHVSYPATRAQLLQSCMVGEFPEEGTGRRNVLDKT
jgi:hypothetical protein